MAPMLKSAGYEVTSRVETEDGNMSLQQKQRPMIKNTDDPPLQTAAKRWKLQISNSDMWAADVFHCKTCYNRFFYF